MATVTQRIKQVKQPRGGYINPKWMSVRQLDAGSPVALDHKAESIRAPLVGLAVDYLTRLAHGAAPRDAFAISLRGAWLLGDVVLTSAEADVSSLAPSRVDTSAIVAACRLSGYDVAYRAGLAFYNPDAQTTPDATTTEHIAVMVARSVAFFREYGPITLDGFTFAGAFTDLVTNGDGDYLTPDTLWDFKVSVRGPTKDNTLQVLMYLLMGQRSGQPEFDGITHLGVFNPRLNTVYRLALADVPAEVVAEVARDVIGY